MQELISEITNLAQTVSIPLIIGYIAYKIVSPQMRVETAFIDAIFLIIIFTSLASVGMSWTSWLMDLIGLGRSLAGWLSVFLGGLGVVLIARLWPAVWRVLDRILPRA